VNLWDVCELLASVREPCHVCGAPSGQLCYDDCGEPPTKTRNEMERERHRRDPFNLYSGGIPLGLTDEEYYE